MLNGGLDAWTLVHFAAGFAVGMWLIGTKGKGIAYAVIVTTFIFALWEVMESLAGPGGFGGAENGLNLLFDMVAAWVGLAVWVLWGHRIGR